MLQLWTQVTQCPNEACTRKRSQRLQYCTSSTSNWNECFCLGHWQLTCSTSYTIYHISPDENHFKHRDLQRISKQPQQTQQHYLSMKTNQATLTDLHHHGHCAQQPLLCLSATPLSQDLGGVNPYTWDNSCTQSQMSNCEARQKLKSGFHSTVFQIIFKLKQNQIPSHDLSITASTSPDCILALIKQQIGAKLVPIASHLYKGVVLLCNERIIQQTV